MSKGLEKSFVHCKNGKGRWERTRGSENFPASR